MPGIVQQHHHRSTTKGTQKSHNPKFTSKNVQRDQSKGRVERLERGARKTPHQQVMSKFDRRNQAKQKRLANHKDHERVTSVFAGRDGAPRIVAVIPLCDDIVSSAVIKQLKSSVDIEDSSPEKSQCFSVDRFKQKLQFVTPSRDLLEILDACSIADYVIGVLSSEREVDDYGELILKSIEGQGISTVYTAVQVSHPCETTIQCPQSILLTACQHLEKIDPPKRRPQALLSLKSYITHFFPNQTKLYSLDSRQECQNLVRSLCTTTPNGITSREQRSWLLVDDVRWQPETANSVVSVDETMAPSKGQVVMTGVIRGQNLKADRLLHVGGWGDFQISRITKATSPDRPQIAQDNSMAVDTLDEENVLGQPTEDRDNLDELAPVEAVMNDVENDDTMTLASTAHTERKTVLLDDEQYYSGEENENVADLPKRLPRGTSNYQAAWYLGDDSDSGSDIDDEDEDFAMKELTLGNDDDKEENAARSLMEGGQASTTAATAPSTIYSPSDDESSLDGRDDLDAYRSQKSALSRAEADRQFPDEIELPPTVAARDRLRRYRGLKNARTSPWNTLEDKPYEPSEWPRLLDIADYRAAKSKVLRESLVGGVKAGTRVDVHLRGVPASFWDAYNYKRSGSTPTQSPQASDAGHYTPPTTDTATKLPLLKAYTLLRHEHKHTLNHSTLTVPTSFPHPIENKSELILQVGGMRRFVVRPVFTAVGATPNNVHKVERWVWPGETVRASWVGPVTWGSVPVLWFVRGQTERDEDGLARADDDEDVLEQDIAMRNNNHTTTTTTNPSQLTLLGTGTLLPSSTTPTLALRTILTGQPAAIHRTVTTIRYMFFNREDVAYFRSLPLWTNRGRRGVIKEAVGTHGRFKAVFEGRGGGGGGGGKKGKGAKARGVNVQESVGVRLWRREWPGTARPLLLGI